MSFAELTEIDKRVLSTIRRNPNNKKTRIAELAKTPWTTTISSIEKLEKNKMISLAQSDSDYERNTYHLAAEYAYLVGVSIGTSRIKVCVLDFAFNIVEKNVVHGFLQQESQFREQFWIKNEFTSPDSCSGAVWCANTPSKGLLDVKRLINDLCSFALELNNKSNILAIGFSFPGHVDNENGVIVKSSNLNFDLNNVGMNTLFTNDMLSCMKENNINICFDHNVKAAAIAERTVGNLRNVNANAAVLYFGTGLGVALWLDGRLYRGKSNAAGQLGHIKTDYNQSQYPENTCSCGNKGCLEQNIRDLFDDNQFVKNSTGKQIAEWLDKNEEKKAALVEYLSKAIFNISSLLEIDYIVFSGKLGEIYPSIENLFQEKMIQNGKTQINIIVSNLHEYSASIGTAICGYYRIIDFPID